MESIGDTRDGTEDLIALPARNQGNTAMSYSRLWKSEDIINP